MDLTTLMSNGVNLGGFMSGASKVLIGLALLGLFAVIGYFLWYYLQFKVKILIRQPIKEGIDRYLSDKGRVYFDKKRGTEVLKLWKKKSVVLEAPDEKDYDLFGKKKLLRLYNPATSSFLIDEPPKNYEQGQILKSHLKLWYGLDYKRSLSKRLEAQSKFERVAPYLAIGVVAVVCLVMFIIATKFMGSIVDQATATAEALRSSLEQVTITRIT